MCRKNTSETTEFLLGNEAIAAGALSAGVRYAASYPGTPASEILPAFFALARKAGVDAAGGWMINEKVAFEAALMASWSGIDAMVSMKQVGLNVAMDPLMSAAYTGTEAGFIVVSVDDPGPYSSQTEQDSRFMAMAAKIPVFDPSTPQDACNLMGKALSLSRRFKIPVMLRPVLRVSHSRQSVRFELPQKAPFPKPDFRKKPGVWTATPKFRFKLHQELNEKITAISRENSADLEKRLGEVKNGKIIYIASGALYGYLKDLGVENLIKVDMPYPLDQRLLQKICDNFQEIWVIEETYPVIELQMPDRRRVKGRLSGHIPREGEITLQKLKEIIDPASRIHVQVKGEDKKPRLCPGCGHRTIFYAMRRTFPKGIFPGDIGCYTLGTNIGAVDTFVCMGSSISMAMAIAELQKRSEETKPVVCTIGDSTLFHAGIPPLIEAVNRGVPMVVAILDNGTTAMTGGQPVPKTDIKRLVEGCGVERVEQVHGYNLEEACSKLKELWQYSLEHAKPSVLICRCPCVIYGERPKDPKIPKVKEDVCTNCGICYKIFECPAIEERGGKAWINELYCTGCGVCIQVCPKGAICH